MNEQGKQKNANTEMTHMLLELSDEQFKTAIITLLQQDSPSHLKQMEKKSDQKIGKGTALILTSPEEDIQMATGA